MSDLPTLDAAHPRWPATWVRALLPLAILVSLEERPLHGYAIAQSVGALGFGVPRGGSLYPALARLEEAGTIVAQWVPGPSGPARREYTLTASGRERLAAERSQLTDLSSALAPASSGSARTSADSAPTPTIESPSPHPSTIGDPDDDGR
ncbi:PadR family transcriptional regulator [Brachybacterium sp. ACRRE]|uniref:PadR family transcriptional regulator n=1 Tax=Brachybacterium sp. ACRRE TaxID=2918184 RepID=UPI001EF2656B|nr:PadR family transcriptional regulator [Brachybacterium sp. ACRRE]MCG7310358.1 PadR family transcriptional regulator [Brachybacterium sp. ACRRE]